MAAALAGQGLAEASAGTLVDGWMRDFTAGLGAQATPDAAIAQQNTQASEVPVSAQDKAIADLANPDKAAASS